MNNEEIIVKVVAITPIGELIFKIGEKVPTGELPVLFIKSIHSYGEAYSSVEYIELILDNGYRMIISNSIFIITYYKETEDE